MRSLAVRILVLLVVVLVGLVLFARSPEDPAEQTMDTFLAEIDELDRQSAGAFSNTLRSVLADPTRSVPFKTFRLPAREGIDAVTATFPEPADGYEGIHHQRLVVFMAAALQDCATDADRRARYLVLAERYGVPPYSRQ